MRILLRLALVSSMVPVLFGACLCQGPCESDADCPNDGEICATDSGVCRAPLTCADAGCGANQLCDERTAEDSVCLEACVSGYGWDGDARACVSSPEGCAMCETLNQVCVNPIGPQCGDCVEGYVDDGAGNCVPDSNCDPAPAQGSILEMCNGINRTCVEDAAGAMCGGCALGYIEVSGVCELEVACDQDLIDDCAADNRECIEDPNGQCGACLEGFVAETDANGDIAVCRAPLTCADLSCAGICNPAIQGANAADAFCSDPCTGPTGNDGIEDANGNCIECGACDDAANGEDGPYLQALFAGNQCVCDSLPGFYYDPQLNDTEPCDADGDGWTRENAKLAADLGDSVVDATYHCTVRRVNAFVLEREDGQQLSVPVSPAADLYESNRNDDQALLAVSGLEPYGGTSLVASELNGLTKACVSTGQAGDYNDNGTPDPEEYHGQPLQSGESDIHTPFLAFAYFTELHRGWYEPPSGGVGAGTYYIREKSRALNAAAGDAVALTVDDVTVPGADGGVPEVTNGYWRTCERYVSADYDTATAAGSPLTTLDFAEHGENGGFVMGHHSQFRCLQVVSNDATDPHEVTANQLGSQVSGAGAIYDRVMTCAKTGTIGPVTGTENPDDAELSCTEVPNPAGLANASVVWAIASFLPYADGDLVWSNGDNYTRGCIDECAELRNTCPGFTQQFPNNVACDGSVTNYGKLFCGCAVNLGGPDCSFACPGFDPRIPPGNADSQGSFLFVENDYSLAPRSGWWMCGAPSASSGTFLGAAPTVPNADGGVVDGGSGGWTLYGEVPAQVTPQEPLCGQPDAGPDGGVECYLQVSGYTLSGAGRR